LPPGNYPFLREFREPPSSAGLIPTVYNNTSIASTFSSLSTSGGATAPALIEGGKIITAVFFVSGTFTASTNAVVSLEVSMVQSFAGAQAIGTATVSAAGNFYITAQNVAYKFARLRITTAQVNTSGSNSLQGAFVYATN
jgi:hypothetical protein